MREKIRFLSKILTLIITLMSSTGELISAKPQFNYISEEITSVSGLPHDTIYCIEQDEDGYIWIGTEKGIVKHDGTYFKIFNRQNTPLLLNNSITSIKKDRSGGLWIGSYGGGIIFHKKNEFISAPFKLTGNSAKIWKLYVDNSEALWIGTIGGGVIKYYQGKVKRFIFPSGRDSNVRDILSTKNNKIIVGTEGGLYIKSGEQFQKLKTEHRKNLFIMSLYQKRDGNILIGTDNGLYLGKITGERLKIIYHKEIGNIIRNIQKYNNSVIIISENGLKKEISNVFIYEKFKTDFFYNPLTVAFRDRENILWVGSAGLGLAKLWERRIYSVGENTGLNYVNMNVILKDHSGNLWMGSNNRGIYIQTKNGISGITKNNGLISNEIFSLFQDSADQIWVGTKEGITLFPHGLSGSIKSPYSKLRKPVLSLNEDLNGNILAGTKEFGLFQIDLKSPDKRITNIIKNISVFSIKKNFNNSIMLCTDQGIWIEDKISGSFSSFSPLIKNEKIFDMLAESKEIIWLAAGDKGFLGLIKGEIISFSPLKQFPNQSFFGILSSKDNNFWISTDYGIVSVKRRELIKYSYNPSGNINYTFFNRNDGLQSPVCKGGMQPTGIISEKDTIFFATRSGISYFNHSKFKPNKIPPSIRINSVLVNGKKIKIDDHSDLSPETEKISIEYSIISHFQPKKIKFRYTLTGPDGLVIGQIEKNQIIFKNLSSGRYSFLLTAANNDGDWNYKGASLYFRILPYFYKTVLFRILILSILTFIFFIALRSYRIYSMKKKEKNKKYKSSTLSPIDSGIYFSNLKNLFYREKLFLDPNITIKDISRRIGVPAKIISQTVNEITGENFKNFINRYRVEEIKKKFKDPKYRDAKLITIAYETGFNSKSVFNSVFKKFTGKSPSEYRKNLKKTKS